MKTILFSMLFVAVCATASSQPFELTVQTVGTGSGKVVGKLPDGTIAITCAIQPPATCKQLLPGGSTVTLTATSEPKQTFTGWDGDTGSAAACSGTAPCTFTLNANSSVRAFFSSGAQLFLRVTGPGTATFKQSDGTLRTVGSGQSVAVPFLYNQQVSITAIPASGSNFTGWFFTEGSLGGSPGAALCSPTANPCSFAIDKRIFVEAKFSTPPPPPPPPPPVTITVAKSGSGTGTVVGPGGINCGSSCSSSVSPQTKVVLKATPAGNSRFKMWTGGTGSATGCNNSTSELCPFAASQNSRITAVFEPAQ